MMHWWIAWERLQHLMQEGCHPAVVLVRKNQNPVTDVTYFTGQILHSSNHSYQLGCSWRCSSKWGVWTPNLLLVWFLLKQLWQFVNKTATQKYYPIGNRRIFKFFLKSQKAKRLSTHPNPHSTRTRSALLVVLKSAWAGVSYTPERCLDEMFKSVA